jgi:hypothetical protein
MYPPEFRRIVRYENSVYAEIFFPRGELGAPCPVWWDLRMCEHKLKTYKNTPDEIVYQQAVDALKRTSV